MKPGIKKRLIFYPVLYVLVGVFLYFRQRQMIYFPTEPELHGYAEEHIENAGESIRVIVLNPDKEKAIIYFGGNAEEVVNNAYIFQKIFADYSVYLFTYRGYSGSSGKPTEAGIFSDALALYDLIKSRHTAISVMGRSLGSGVAAYMASEREIDKVVLITPFDSILAVAQNRIKIYPLSFMLLDHYNSLSRVKNIKAPTLVLMAENDRVIPRKNSLRFVQAFPEEQIRTLTMKGAGHNTISDDPGYYLQLKKFFSPEGDSTGL
ncbi:alpha/beta hydrolase [Kiritimatiellaeota bacterium B1221]|nr:alpha/beta hydrolase [Kiritimatiellaeota bacterium B1221]